MMEECASCHVPVAFLAYPWVLYTPGNVGLKDQEIASFFCFMDLRCIKRREFTVRLKGGGNFLHVNRNRH